MNTDILFSSKSVEWSTPQEVFDELNREFNFNLDPCSTDENCKCANHYTKETDGLSQDWGGRGCSAIHHTEGNSRNGLRNATKRAKNQTLW